MRRTIMIATAITMLITASAASAASAALNTYKHTNFAFTPPNKAGTAKQPAPVGYVETLAAQSATPGNRAGPLTHLKTTIYGLVSNAGSFPTCTDTTRMVTQKSDSFCPKRALVASGPVNVILGGADLSIAGGPCSTVLHVWNGGKGKLWFFFTTTPSGCGGLKTGDTPAYPGFVKQRGKNLVTDVPLPLFLSTSVAFHPGLYSSLVLEQLRWGKITTKVKGKTIGYQASIGCKNGRRPWSNVYTATDGHSTESKTVTGSQKCS